LGTVFFAKYFRSGPLDILFFISNTVLFTVLQEDIPPPGRSPPTFFHFLFFSLWFLYDSKLVREFLLFFFASFHDQA